MEKNFTKTCFFEIHPLYLLSKYTWGINGYLGAIGLFISFQIISYALLQQSAPPFCYSQ